VGESLKKDYIECTVTPHILGGAVWTHYDKTIFCVHHDGRKEDLRKAPPYLAMSPCPYCGVTGPRAHDPLKHVDPTLGTPVKAKDE
jgi:hypothetical protein